MKYEFDDNVPIYIQLMDIVKIKLVKGELRPGEQIPAVREFASDYGVNPNTAQKALTELERENILRSERTAGRFVSMNESEIEQLRKNMAKEVMANFIVRMHELGFDNQQLLESITQEVEK